MAGDGERATLGAKEKVVKDACGMIHQEDHWALRSAGLEEPEMGKQPSTEKSSPSKIKTEAS